MLFYYERTGSLSAKGFLKRGLRSLCSTMLFLHFQYKYSRRTLVPQRAGRTKRTFGESCPRVPGGPLRIPSESLESCCIHSQKEQHLRLNPLHKIQRATQMIYFLHMNRRAHLYILSSFSKKIAKKKKKKEKKRKSLLSFIMYQFLSWLFSLACNRTPIY